MKWTNHRISFSLFFFFPFLKWPLKKDTEFPGVVAKIGGDFKATDYQYQNLKCNVDLLKIIQLGFTFMNEKGATPVGASTFQFNFHFNLKYSCCFLVCSFCSKRFWSVWIAVCLHWLSFFAFKWRYVFAGVNRFAIEIRHTISEALGKRHRPVELCRTAHVVRRGPHGRRHLDIVPQQLRFRLSDQNADKSRLAKHGTGIRWTLEVLFSVRVRYQILDEKLQEPERRLGRSGTSARSTTRLPIG